MDEVTGVNSWRMIRHCHLRMTSRFPSGVRRRRAIILLADSASDASSEALVADTRMPVTEFVSSIYLGRTDSAGGICISSAARHATVLRNCLMRGRAAPRTGFSPERIGIIETEHQRGSFR